MANTVVKGDHTIAITFDGSDPWDGYDAYPDGLLVESFEFKPTATDDLMAVREKVAGGVFYFHEKAATAFDNKIKYYNTDISNKLFYPYIVGAEASAGAILIIQLK